MLVTFINSYIKFFKENLIDIEERCMIDQVFWVINSFACLGWESKSYLNKFGMIWVLLSYVFPKEDDFYYTCDFTYLKYPKAT